MPARSTSSQVHKGEVAVHELLKVPYRGDPTNPGLPSPHAARVAVSPLVALGTLDAQGRLWTTILGGERGFARPVAEDVLALNSRAVMVHDPVLQAFWAAGEETGERGERGVVQPHGGQGKMISALSIDFSTRDRIKLYGQMIAGAVVTTGGSLDDDDSGFDVVQIALHVTGALGNCPKYLNKREIQLRDSHSDGDDNGEEQGGERGTGFGDVQGDLPLSMDAMKLIAKADVFFMSSTDGSSMDTNHRGGPRGFMRVERNRPGQVSLIYPEYSGNRLYQTLGNLYINPLVGIVIPDFETSDVLYVTGVASILVGTEASSLMGHTKLAVRIVVSAARLVKRGLPFRGDPIDFSPYNPPVRYLLSEREAHMPGAEEGNAAGANTVAQLTKRELLTPTVARFTFTLEWGRRGVGAGAGGKRPQWEAGQYVTLAFEDELDHGYSHMRDDDPQSLNDDFVRTFTISSRPQLMEEEEEGERRGEKGRGEERAREMTFEITARKHGAATNLLWKHNMRAPLEIPVLGFGGDEAFRMRSSMTRHPVFVAGGVGITPVLAQAPELLPLQQTETDADLKVLWSVKAEDLPLVQDSLRRIPGLAGVTTLFVTGRTSADTDTDILGSGAAVAEGDERSPPPTVMNRRLARDDFAELIGRGRKFFLCAGPGLLGLLNEWLEGEERVWEDFGY